MDVSKSSIGELIIEGKTKKVFDIKSSQKNLVYILSKDRITAGDGVKAHEMKGKSILSTQTNCAIFEYLNAIGVRTHFVSRVSNANVDNERAFVAKKCGMIPIEWVARRVATGSYLKRNPHVKEGYRFAPLKLETFFKDDANHDPYWSIETIIEAQLNINGLVIDKRHVREMLEITNLVFKVLERVWQTLNHSLIDMKIEFGVIDDESGGKSIVVADVIDNDSWRLWPFGDKRLMLDKQVYRNMSAADIDEKAIELVKANFEVVAQRTQKLFSSLILTKEEEQQSPVVVILIGSLTDKEFANRIKAELQNKYKLFAVEIHVCSAHKTTNYALDVIAEVDQWSTAKAIIACAGRSNGLGPVTAANIATPVINCPPASDIASLELDVWSSLRMPSGIGCSTTLGAEEAALNAAKIVANGEPFVWSIINTQQSYTKVKTFYDDSKLN